MNIEVTKLNDNKVNMYLHTFPQTYWYQCPYDQSVYKQVSISLKSINIVFIIEH